MTIHNLYAVTVAKIMMRRRISIGVAVCIERCIVARYGGAVVKKAKIHQDVSTQSTRIKKRLMTRKIPKLRSNSKKCGAIAARKLDTPSMIVPEILT